MMLIIQTSLRLPPEALYAALIAAFVGLIAGALLASSLRKLLSKLYPSPEERHRKAIARLPKGARGSEETTPSDGGDGRRPVVVVGGGALAAPPPAQPERSQADLPGTFRMLGASLVSPIMAIIRRLDELDPLLREGRSEDREFQSKVNECLDGLRADLSNINRAVLDIPTAVRGAVSGYFDEEQRRKDEEQRRREEQHRRAREEEEQRRRDDAERRKRELHKAFVRRLEELRKSDLMQTSLLTKQIADGLSKDPSEPSRFEDLLPPYARLISAAEDVRGDLVRPDFFSGDDPVAAAERVERKFGEVEAAREDLERAHRPLCLVDLLERAKGHQELEGPAQNLRELLNLEEVTVDIGTEPEAQQMEELDVVAKRGHGARIVISEVLGSGYRLKETGMVVRKPRVVVSLEG